MTPTMRRTRPAAPLLAGSLGLLAALALTGCTGYEGDDPAADPTSATSVTEEPDEETEDAEDEVDGGDDDGEDTYEDTYEAGSVPVTVVVPVKDLPGFEEVLFWEGTEVSEGPRLATGGVEVGGEELVVQAISLEPVISQDDARGEVRYWARNNSFTEEPAEVLDPVVVDGEDLEHARGVGGERQYDYFTRIAPDGSAVALLFNLPRSLTEAEREDYTASVLAAVDFE